MFVEWGFLLGEIWALIALAALLGLLAGWLIWGGREDFSADAEEARLLRAELERARARNRASLSEPVGDVPPEAGVGYTRPAHARPTPAAPTESPTPADPPAPEPAKSAKEPAKPATVPDPASDIGTKPIGLDAPRDGLPDDLTKIKGVGAKLQGVCNALGYWHYEQIANWTADEIAWVDENLEGFKGRVTRDRWVDQAKALAVNETPVFVRRPDG